MLLNLFFPTTCLICSSRTSNQNLCLSCRSMLPLLPPHCQRCGHLLKGTDNRLCGACQACKVAFDTIFALFPYVSPCDRLITNLKFGHKLAYGQALAELLIDKMRTEWYAALPLPERLIPIPLHNTRLRERGFNQALEIAKPISRYFAIPLDRFGVTRIKATKAQSGLSAKARQANLAKAFQSKQDYRGLHVLVIDDVITTGHTIDAFCQILRQQGAAKIDVCCCARTITTK